MLLSQALLSASAVGLGCGAGCGSSAFAFLSAYILSEGKGLSAALRQAASFLLGKLLAVAGVCVCSAILGRAFLGRESRLHRLLYLRPRHSQCFRLPRAFDRGGNRFVQLREQVVSLVLRQLLRNLLPVNGERAVLPLFGCFPLCKKSASVIGDAQTFIATNGTFLILPRSPCPSRSASYRQGILVLMIVFSRDALLLTASVS